jgi:hypothetical protein
MLKEIAPSVNRAIQGTQRRQRDRRPSSTATIASHGACASPARGHEACGSAGDAVRPGARPGTKRSPRNNADLIRPRRSGQKIRWRSSRGASCRPPREGSEPSRRLSLVICFRGTQRVAARARHLVGLARRYGAIRQRPRRPVLSRRDAAITIVVASAFLRIAAPRNSADDRSRSGTGSRRSIWSDR